MELYLVVTFGNRSWNDGRLCTGPLICLEYRSYCKQENLQNFDHAGLKLKLKWRWGIEGMSEGSLCKLLTI